MAPSELRAPRLKPLVLLAAGLALAAGCAGSGPAGGAGAGTAVTSGDVLDETLFPMTSASRRFAADRGGRILVSIEPSADGATLRMGAAGARIEVIRTATGLVFSAGPQSTTELIRTGAAPGATWTSGDAAVRFDGWERITVPAGTFDAARIRSSTGPESLRIVETWWFARGTGLVRLRADRGGIFADEMSLAPSE